MDILCTSDICPVLLNSTCVFYEGSTLIYTGITTNDSLQTALQKIDAKFGNAMVGYIFTNGVVQLSAGQPVKLGGSLIENTTIGGNFTLSFVGPIIGSKLATAGGTVSEFLKGDGTLDSTPYQIAGAYITNLSGDITASGPGSAVATLTNVNSNPGTYGTGSLIPVVTVDTKGRVTALTTTAISVPSGILSFVGDVFGSGTTGSTTTLTLSNVNSNIYTNNTFLKFRVNAKGLVTGAAPITDVDIQGALGYVPVPNTRTITINGVTQTLQANRSWTLPGGGSVTNVSVIAGTGISASVTDPATTPVITITNTAPDQVVSIASGSGINVTGTYPNFTVAATSTGSVTSVTASAPLASSGGATPNITIVQSTSVADGYLSSTDWNTFNSKQSSGNYITSLTGEATATGPGAAVVTLSTAAVTGKILTGVNITGGTVVATDTILQGFGKLQNQINGLIGGSIYQGVWNATTNTPTLVSGVGVSGYYYIVNVAGNTNLNGITSWNVGDWAIFHGGVWQKVDNTDAVVSVNGFTGAVSLSTTDVLEGTNLYYTSARTRGDISLTTSGTSGSATYSSTTGVFNIPNYSTDLSGYVPNSRTLTINGTSYDLSADRSWTIATGSGTVTSVALTVPSAFSVSGSPITTSGTLAVTAIGTASQYIRGDGVLANFPTSGGGGSSVSYYFNSSVSQGTIGGVAYRQLNKTPIIGAGTDITISTNGYVANYLTNPNDPALLEIPGGNWNFEIFFSASSGGGNPSFYVELYKYDGSTFTLIASNSGTPKLINDGTSIEAYFSVLAVPQTTLTLTDRLAVRIYVNTSGRTITLHTENGHLSQVITTFTTGLTALNNLTAQVQYLATGTSGADFNISSATDIHTFNLPTASAANRGALSTADWTTFNGKQDALTFSSPLVNTTGTISIPVATISVNGYLSSTDWNTFNGKQAGSANLTSIATLAFASTSFVKMTGANTFALDTTVYYPASNPNGYTSNIGTVTSVAALTIGTTGTDLSSSVATGTTTPVITLNVPTASAANRGALSSTDWTTFNNKQNALGFTAVPTTRTLTINGVAFDLSANRSWTIASTDTLANVTARGATTTGAITVNGDLTVGSGGASSINMNDSDEGMRMIHCNSNRIGFLTQAQNWGSYCNDDGSWVSVGDVTAFSDARIKENIVTVDDALEKVLALRGVYYNRTDTTDKSKKLGVIAQEVQQVIPEVVHEEADGMLGVSYGNMGGLFIEAFKELNAKVESQANEIEELKALVNNLLNK